MCGMSLDSGSFPVQLTNPYNAPISASHTHRGRENHVNALVGIDKKGMTVSIATDRNNCIST